MRRLEKPGNYARFSAVSNTLYTKMLDP